MEYSKRLGNITDQQFQQALDSFKLGKLIKAEPIPFGNFGQNVFLTTSTGEYVFRGKPHYPWQFKGEQFMANLLHEKTSSPVPHPYLVDEKTDIFGWSYVLMPRLNGKLLKDEAVKSTLSKEDKLEIARALGENLAEMQKVTWSYPGQYNLEANDIKPFEKPWDEWVISKIKDRLEKSLGYNDKTPQKDVDWVNDLISRGHQALTTPFVPTFVMHDYQDSNVVVDKVDGIWKVTGVFDLMENYFGDGEADLSRVWFAYHEKDMDLGYAFLNAYFSKKKARTGFTDRFPVYMLWDRLVIWEWAQRNGKCWWSPELTFRDWVEPSLNVDANLLR